MTSLTDVYEGEVGRVASRRQQLVGTALFLVGVAGLVGAIALATTGVGNRYGLDAYAARRIAGIIAGLGLPSVILGVFAVLPASRRIRLTALGGTGVATVGVALFQSLYPYNWTSSDPLLALLTGVVYFVGIVTAFWCLFASLATFKTRNDPGGTARMEVTEEGTIRLVEEARSLPGLGGIGFFGEDPDGGVETQTNRPGTAGDGAVSDGGTGQRSGETRAATDRSRQRTTDAQSDRNRESQRRSDSGTETEQQTGRQTSARSNSSRRNTTSRGTGRTGPSENALDPKIAEAGPEASPSTDGGTATTGHDTITETAVHQGEPDTYCGNCRHFEYVMQDGDIEPYCSFHGEIMDDMDACSAWVRND
jgi:cytochrome c biogenesis protein CcdA